MDHELCASRTFILYNWREQLNGFGFSINRMTKAGGTKYIHVYIHKILTNILKHIWTFEYTPPHSRDWFGKVQTTKGFIFLRRLFLKCCI